MYVLFQEANEELEAVGQVYRLDSDGSVHIWWPNNTITKTYPQDLFLITDDVSITLQQSYKTITLA